MLWNRDQFDVVYNKIKEASLQACCTVLIMVSPDVDAIAACRIFTSLLRSDNVSYKIKAVSGYLDMKKASDELLQDNEEIKSIVLLNCGGSIDITSVLTMPPACTAYIIDCHRPVHLTNIYNDDNVIFFNDGTIDTDDIPSDGSILDIGANGLSDDDSDDDDSSSSDEEDDSDGDDTMASSPKKENAKASTSEGEGGSVEKTVISDSENEDNTEEDEDANVEEDDKSSEADDEDEGEEDVHEEGGGGGGKDKTTKNTSGRKEMSATERKAMEEEEYYSGEEETENMGDSVNKNGDDNDGSILGKRKRDEDMKQIRNTKRVRRRKLDHYYSGTYYGKPIAVLMYELAQQLNKDRNDLLWLAIVGLTDHYINGKITHDHYSLHVNPLHQEVLTKNTDEIRTISAQDGTLVSVKEDGKIVFQDEFRFMLHRHWSLYDSMYYSSFVASRLNIWKMNGASKLNTFFAKMGISLDQAKQRYSFMSQDNKRKLDTKMEDAAEEFGLSEYSYGSFTRVMGFKTPLSAADVVHIATALLECGGKPGQSWLASFNKAYDSLLSKRTNLLQEGLDLSMRLQKAVVRQGISIIEKRKITNAGPFRYTYMEAISEGDLQMFTQALALSTLARFVVESYRVSGKWVGKNARPFVICALNERTGTYMVVGVTCSDQDGDIELNKFGHAFREAANQIKARFKHDGFDSAVMEIDKDDVLRFIESLHEIMTV